MQRQENGQARLRWQHGKHAIDLAMQGRWQEAVAANKEIIDGFPNDVEAYNRLGRAYMELGEYAQAREAYGRAAEVDPYNAIAKKNLNRLSYLGEAVAGSEGDSDKVEPEHFIEEVGRAGVVNLYHLAPQEVRVRMVAGDRVYLRADGANLVVENGRGEYLGQVAPKHGRRLVKLTEGGNKYEAAIVSSVEDVMTVIIREVYQDPSQEGKPSFPTRGLEGVRHYVTDRILRRGLEYEEESADEPGYTIISDTGEVEVFTEESSDIDEKDGDEE